MSNRQERLVSIVVPAYNAERFIGDSIASILQQSYRELEIIVCDDASTDATGSVVERLGDPRVRYVRSEQNRGGYGAMNWGASYASGEYLAFYHADDLYGPDIVAKEVAFLQGHEDVGAVFCLDRFIDERGAVYAELSLPPEVRGRTTLRSAELTDAMLRRKNTFLRTPGVMFRRAAFEATGGFDQKRFGIAADADMWLRLSMTHAIGLIPEHLFSYRHFPQQWSRIYERLRTTPEMYFAVMDHHLSRPGVRASVSSEALTRYKVWRVTDEAERASNALMLGDPNLAVAILNTSLVRPLLKSTQKARVARVLALRTLVRLAVRAGGGEFSRGLVHVARFRRLPPRKWAAPASTASHSLAPEGVVETSTAGAGPTRGKASRATALRVFIDPFTTHFYGNGLFDPQSKYNRDNALAPWFRLKERLAERRLALDTADYLVNGQRSAKTNVYVSFGVRDNYRALAERDDVLLTAFYLFEVVVVAPEMYAAIPELARYFRRVYSWSDAESLARFVPGDCPVAPFRIPMPNETVLEPYWSRRERAGIIIVNSNKLAALQDGELYTGRLRAIKYFDAHGGIELWGRLWDKGLGTPQLDAEFGDAVRRVWRGPVADKYEAMSRCRYAICFENMILRGWVTEKIFDCFYAGTIPVYFGAPDIADHIPADCYIDFREFSSYDDLRKFLDGLGEADRERYREAGRAYLGSAAFRPYSADAFADRFLGDVETHLRERGLSVPW